MALDTDHKALVETVTSRLETITITLAECKLPAGLLETSNLVQSTDEKSRILFEFENSIKTIHDCLAHVHAAFRQNRQWFAEEPTGEDVLLQKVHATLTSIRGWVLARFFSGNVPQEQLNLLGKKLVTAVDNIYLLLWFTAKLDDHRRYCIIKMSLQVPPNQVQSYRLSSTHTEDVDTLNIIMKWLQCRLLLHHFSALTPSLRARMLSNTFSQDVNIMTKASGSILQQFMQLITHCEYLAVWEPKYASDTIPFSGGHLYDQLVVTLALVAFQLEPKDYSIWEQCVLTSILNGSDFCALVATDAWSIVGGRLSTSTLKATVHYIEQLLRRAIAYSPLRERLGYLLGRLILMLPEVDRNNVRQAILAPLKDSGYEKAAYIENTLCLLSCMPLSVFSSSGFQSTIQLLDEKVNQIIHLIVHAIEEESMSRKKDLDLIRALTVPANCLAHVLCYLPERAPLSQHTLSTLQSLPKLLKICAAWAGEQPQQLDEINQTVHALLTLATVAPITSATAACEILSFCRDWMTIDPSGAGKYYAVRFAGNCGTIVFEADAEIRATNLLVRIFTAAFESADLLTQQEACLQYIRFATLTSHVELVKKLVPANARQRVAAFEAKTPISVSETTNVACPDLSSLDGLRWLQRILSVDALTNTHPPRAIASLPPLPNTQHSTVTMEATISMLDALANEKRAEITAETCSNAAQVVRRYLRTLRRQPDFMQNSQIFKDLLALRRDLDMLDVDQ